MFVSGYVVEDDIETFRALSVGRGHSSYKLTNLVCFCSVLPLVKACTPSLSQFSRNKQNECTSTPLGRLAANVSDRPRVLQGAALSVHLGTSCNYDLKKRQKEYVRRSPELAEVREEL